MPFMVLERLGVTLGSRIYTAKLSWPEVLGYVKQMAAAVQHMHTSAIDGHAVRGGSGTCGSHVAQSALVNADK